jgi:hypothetical protein
VFLLTGVPFITMEDNFKSFIPCLSFREGPELEEPSLISVVLEKIAAGVRSLIVFAVVSWRVITIFVHGWAFWLNDLNNLFFWGELVRENTTQTDIIQALPEVPQDRPELVGQTLSSINSRYFDFGAAIRNLPSVSQLEERLVVLTGRPLPTSYFNALSAYAEQLVVVQEAVRNEAGPSTRTPIIPENEVVRATAVEETAMAVGVSTLAIVKLWGLFHKW